MHKTYIVRLTDDERQELIQLTKSGQAAAYKIKHAHILLHVDANGPNWSDAQVATALHCHGNTVRNVRQRFVEHGLAAALVRKKQAQPSRPCLLDGAADRKKKATLHVTPAPASPRTALSHGAMLLSRNLTDFQQVPGLHVEDWTQPGP